MFYGKEPYFQSGWNIMDGSLVSVSIVDILMSLISDSSPRIFGILRVRTVVHATSFQCQRQFLHVARVTGISSPKITATFTSDQQSTRVEISRTNAFIVLTTYWKYRIDMLHVFHNFRYPRSSGIKFSGFFISYNF